jgi:hypothetical protein
MLTDSPLVTVALATVPTMLVVALGILLNNQRLTDLRADLSGRIGDLKETLRAEIKVGDAAILSRMAQYQMDIISKIAGLDNRITRLEP